ncbi:MAG: SusC/RagA family TonB-linked outer membrane protein [Bacteroidales bacterium]|nr:SusC/RagA family TonB-linked outer membrane protein [Bacteroidales bacterium]
MNYRYLLTPAIVMCATAAFAQQQQRISGHVFNKVDGPVAMANVVEKDKSNRIVSATQTDNNGNFSLQIRNTANTLEISYIGYTTEKISPIGDRTTFGVELQDRNAFNEATVVATRKVKSNGLTINEREISTATQTLNMDALEGLAFETAGDALQGQIAGLDIVANSGNLGAGTSMRLRGVSSINGDCEPLIVVDGYILESYDKEELDMNDLENEEKFANLLQVAPEDIQSIKVLKDAAAAAIWGARGSNGVIEITTRRGKRGKTKVNFSYRFNGNWQPEGMKMLDGDGYSMMLKEAYFNPKQSDVASGIVELMYLQDHPAYYANYNKNTDWIKAVQQFGQSHNYSVNLTGGGEKATFRVSGSYDHEIGSIIKQSLDRFSTRLALDYWVSDRIKFSSNFSLVYTKNNKNYDGQYVNTLLGKAYQAMPNMSVTRWEYDQATGQYYDTGEYYVMPPTAGAAGLVANNSNQTSYYLGDMVGNGNPVAIANEAFAQTQTYTISPQLALEYKLLGKDDDEHQLNYTGEVQMNAFTESDNNFFPHSLTSNSWNQGVDLTSDYQNKTFSFNTRHSVVYIPHFENENLALQIMGRFEVNSSNGTTQDLSSTGINGGITDPTVPGYLTGAGTSTWSGHSAAALGTFHFSYGSKYSLDGTLRADGMTKFGAGNKWRLYPAVSGRWNISDEKFFKPLRSVVNMLSVRPGWAINGNANAIADGVIYNKYSAYGYYAGLQGIAPENLRLTEIKPEKTVGWNLGADLAIFDDLIRFDFNYYHKFTSDLLMKGVRVPSSTGFAALAVSNVGSMENEGWELNASTKPILKFGKFHVNLRANIAQNINTLTAMDANVLEAMNERFNYDNENPLNRVQIGHSLGAIYGFRHKGIYAYDYDHNGYFTNDEKNQYYNADGSQNTAAAALGRDHDPALTVANAAPVARDAEGNVIYDKAGNPLQMFFNYGGTNYAFGGGDVCYEDINHDGQINELDIVYLGTSNPLFNGGFGIDFTYGRWTLKTSFNFRVGNKIINMAKMQAEDMRTNRNQMASVAWRWRKNGDVTDIPRAKNKAAGESYNALINDRYVEPGDFLRFQYFQLRYSVDPKKLKKVGLSSLAISASGNYLFTFTKYSGVDPERNQSGYSPCVDNSQTPRSKSFTFSLNFGF